MVGALAVKGSMAGRGLEGDLALMLPAVAGRTLGGMAVKLPAVVCRGDDGTTISMLTGMVPPSGGDAQILGRSMRTDMGMIRGNLGVGLIS